MTTARRSMFATHRGRLVKRVTVGLVVVSFAMLVVSNQVSSDGAQGGQRSEVEAEVVAKSAEADAPRVAAFPADPLDPYEGANAVTNGISVSDLDQAEDAESAAEYQAAVIAAQQFAPAWGTYSYKQTPEEFVSSLPNLTDHAEESLLASVSSSWGDIVDARVTVRAESTSTAPQVLSYSVDRATVSVTVAQTVKSPEGTTHTTRSFVIDLVRVDGDSDAGEQASGSDAGGVWKVDGVVS